MQCEPMSGLRAHEPGAALLVIEGATRTPDGTGPLVWRSWPASMVAIRDRRVAA